MVTLSHTEAPGDAKHAREAQRLAALKRYDILDTPAEEAFERVTKLAAKLLEVPIGMTGFIDETRHWFKSRVGVAMMENAREESFCQHTILQDGVLVVPDATQDERFAQLPVVKYGPVRFYAGTPLTTSDGHNVGTLCVFDVESRPGLTEIQVQVLEDLSHLLIDELELRLMNTKLEHLVDERTAELFRLNAQLQHDAFHDPLTGLANRTLFLDRLSQTMRRQRQRPSAGYAVLFMDFDRFKLVNDSLGHGVGDELLKALGNRLSECVRPGDTVARLGGDEFTILLETVDSVEEATRTAERIQHELAKPLEVAGHSLHSSASIGVVTSEVDHTSADDVLRDADLAMYRAKASGKARCQVFTREMRERAVSLMALENDLRKAVERQELRVFYQPIVSVADERVRGFEALVRWEHPEHGLVSPAEFIPIAEETGIIIELDRWVLREACRQVKAWQTDLAYEANLTVSVNLSGQQFEDPDLAAVVQTVLSETAFEPKLLNLEITESTLMQQANITIATLKRLRATGVQVYIDDFGTGYSSLNYLQRFPVNTLKIDRAFVNQMLQSPESDALIETIITMAEKLNLNVVAEGIETQAQLQRLKALGCGLGQGYFFAKPLRADEVPGYVMGHSVGREVVTRAQSLLETSLTQTL